MVATFNEVIAYFMTCYPVDAPRRLFVDEVQTFLTQKYSAEHISKFTSGFIMRTHNQLVAEFNDRFGTEHALRYRFPDDDASQICGIGEHIISERIEFQDAINALTPAEFEALSANVLTLFGCDEVWKTPNSHDQGIDSFGYFCLVNSKKSIWQGYSPCMAFLAQAKHYSQCKVGSADIREFIGAFELARKRIYSSISDKYPELSLPHYSPVALIFLTTEEVPRTVKLMSRRAGIIVLSSDDICDLFLDSIADKPITIKKDWLHNKFMEMVSNTKTAR
jgi:hypothetical protein